MFKNYGFVVTLLLISMGISITLVNINFTPSLISLLKKEIPLKTNTLQTFSKVTIYSYLDGGADKFLKNGLTKLNVADFSFNNLEFTLEIYYFKRRKNGLEIFKNLTDNTFKKKKKIFFYEDNEELIISHKKKIIRIISYNSFPETLKMKFLNFFYKK